MKATPSRAESARRCSRCRFRGAEARPELGGHVGKPIAVGIRPEALDEPGGRDGDGPPGCADASRPSRRSAPSSSCTSRSTPSPFSSKTWSRGSSTWKRPTTLRRSCSDTDGSRATRRRPARCVGERPARRADRACGRPPPPPLLRSRQRLCDRRVDSWLSCAGHGRNGHLGSGESRALRRLGSHPAPRSLAVVGEHLVYHLASADAPAEALSSRAGTVVGQCDQCLPESPTASPRPRSMI